MVKVLQLFVVWRAGNLNNSFWQTLSFTINVTETFLVLIQSLIPLLNHSNLNEFYICSEAELLKQIHVLKFQANTYLKYADIIGQS